MEKAQNDEVEIDLREIVFLLLNKAWIIVLSAVIGATCVFAYTYFLVQPVYQSQSMIYIMSKTTSLTSLADIQMGTQLTNDYVVFVTSRPVVDKVIDNLKIEESYESLVGKISVNNPNNTRVLEITVSDYDPARAQSIVNELTDVAVERTAQIMDTDPPSVVDYGQVAEKPSSPNLMKNTVLGALVFAILAIAVMIVNYLLNDSIKTSEDVEKYLGLNTLGYIPLEEGTSKKNTRGHDKDARKPGRGK